MLLSRDSATVCSARRVTPNRSRHSASTAPWRGRGSTPQTASNLHRLAASRERSAPSSRPKRRHWPACTPEPTSPFRANRRSVPGGLLEDVDHVRGVTHAVVLVAVVHEDVDLGGLVGELLEAAGPRAG